MAIKVGKIYTTRNGSFVRITQENGINPTIGMHTYWGCYTDIDGEVLDGYDEGLWSEDGKDMYGDYFRESELDLILG
jgi:hypothetical protein